MVEHDAPFGFVATHVNVVLSQNVPTEKHGRVDGEHGSPRPGPRLHWPLAESHIIYGEHCTPDLVHTVGGRPYFTHVCVAELQY